MKIHALRTVVTLAFLATALLGRHAAAAGPPVIEDLMFPGCGATIQECLDHTPDGGILRLATNGPIDEDLDIDHSLALVAAYGFRPVFTPFSIISARSAGSGDQFLVLRGLTWEPAGSTRVVRVRHEGTGRYDVELRDNAFLGVQGTGLGGLVEVGTSLPGPGGPIVLNVRGNTFRLPAGGNWPLELSFTSPTDGIAVVEENTIETADTSQQGAVALYHTEGDLLFYAVHNVVRSKNPEQTAINVYQTGNGTGRTVARIFGNLLRGIDGGMRFGTSMYADHGTIDLLVAHNTILDAHQRAVQVGGREDFGSSAHGVIANNVLVRSMRSDVGIHEFVDTVIETNNLLTKIDPEDSPSAPGPHSIVVTDPGFAGADDFRLAPTSAGINAADPTYIPTELLHDLDGGPRIAGPAADLGAYELSCAPDDTAPHCAPTCSPSTCQSEDPCSLASCVGDTCRITPVTEPESAFCACDRPLPATCAGVLVPTQITRRAEKACVQLDRVTASSTFRQIVRRVRSAQRGWGKARRLLASPRTTIPTDCNEALDLQYADATVRANQLVLQ
ncbi:MAG TPA: hypothetical protein VGR62_10900 [Candidatus Binatia bacterium]|jgi:hypothetical protein|nr:hypothetical protein [Candidatus Binatia bacterium]